MSDSIIIYRSRTEQNTDECVQMLFGWIYCHALEITIAIALFAVAAWWYKRSRNSRGSTG